MRTGFTLVELLVVLAIMSILLAMILGNQDGLGRDAAVRAAAERFAGVCAETRARAMSDRAPYAIAINIENAPGSSGRVLNNRSGGHWYRVVGPREHTASRTTAKTLLIAHWDASGVNNAARTFPELVEALKTTWRGPQYQLQAGKVRFLALGDTDEGARVSGGNQATAATRAMSYGYAPTYPRPWFGYFDPARKRLFPWGGYDHQLGLDEPWTTYTGTKPVTNYTGFFYEGADGAIAGCVNPASRTYNVDWNGDKDFADTDPVRGPETGYVLMAKDAPRPLVSAAWQDFLIVFQPDGRVYCPPFKTNRKRYNAIQALANPTSDLNRYANGVSDTTKPLLTHTGIAAATAYTAAYNFSEGSRYANGSYNAKSEQAEIGHFVRNNGLYHITFAADSADDRDDFATAEAALSQLGTCYRVAISSEGCIQIIHVDRRSDGALSAYAPYPATPAYWTATTAAASSLIAQEMRWGHLHQKLTVSGGAWADSDNPTAAVPRGRPITDLVTPRMLTGKIWWSDD